MRYVPVREDLMDPDRHNFARLFYEAVGEEPSGKVLVLSSSGHTDVSVGGGTKLSRLHNRRLAGLLTDARLRDFHELTRFDFVAYCRGATTRWGGDVVMPLEANAAVVVGEVTVVPGDYVYADATGAIVIPAASVGRVLEEAVRVKREDAAFLEQIRREDPSEVRRRGSDET